MKSHEVLKAVVEPAGAKKVAHDLKVSQSLIYKWCSPWKPEDAVGARNPLDRVLELVDSTGQRHPVEWLCAKAGGIFVDAALVDPEGDLDAECVRQTQALLAEFSNLLAEISASMAEAGIDEDEAAAIREKWQRLQSQGEAFVQACERGLFGPDD